MAESILREGSTGCRVVEKFLKILQVVVQEPGQVFKPFLPSVISLCMEQVYPIIAEVGLSSHEVEDGRDGKGRHCWGCGSSETFSFPRAVQGKLGNKSVGTGSSVGGGFCQELSKKRLKLQTCPKQEVNSKCSNMFLT